MTLFQKEAIEAQIRRENPLISDREDFTQLETDYQNDEAYLSKVKLLKVISKIRIIENSKEFGVFLSSIMCFSNKGYFFSNLELPVSLISKFKGYPDLV